MDRVVTMFAGFSIKCYVFSEISSSMEKLIGNVRWRALPKSIQFFVDTSTINRVLSEHTDRPGLTSSVIVPRPESFSQVAEYQIEQFSPKLRVLDSQGSSLEYKIYGYK